MSKYNLVEYQGNNQTFIWKYPIENFTHGTHLVVRESQEGIFFLNGKIMDTFGPGRHVLETEKLPKLNFFFNFGKSQKPFTAELYFVNLTEIMAIKWGTDSRVQFLEPTYKFPLTIGASGDLSVRVKDSKTLLLKLVGTERDLSQAKLTQFLRSILMAKMKSYIATTIREGSISIFQIDEYLESFSHDIKQKLLKDFDQYGIELVQFNVTTLAKPDGEKEYEKFKELFFRQFSEVAEAKLDQEVELIRANTQAKKALLASETIAKKRSQEGYSYETERSFDIAENVANNDSVAGVASLGVGLGIMQGVTNVISQQTNQALSQSRTQTPKFCPECGQSLSVGAKFCAQCGTKVIQ
jgi:membrane protease subunit (stomatin/prohibitin family)